MSEHDTYAVIMAGGSGTRFWPASRRTRPKQLLALAGGDSLIRETVSRIAPLCGLDKIFIATGQHLRTSTQSALPELAPHQLLVEPVGRNTAPCIAWAAATIARENPDAIVLALPSDQHIRDSEQFRSTLNTAIDSARSGTITTIGIQPTHPETGYGYIEAEPSDDPVQGVRRFVEKPDRARAEEFLANGNFYWNAGMFIFRARDMLAAVRQHLPELARGIDELDEAASRGAEAEVLERVFSQLPAVSIDNGVMEHMDELAVVAGDFGWTDIGSWLSASEFSPKDTHGNSGPPSTVLVEAQGNHVVDLRKSDDKRVIALVGVENLVVVETDDALLVVHREQAQQVRAVVDTLAKRGDRDLI